MVPPLQWNGLHLKAWSWLRGGPPQGHVKFAVECDLMQYENKVGTIEGIHLLNLQNEYNFENVQKPSQKYHLLINATCLGMLIRRNQKKAGGLGLVCILQEKIRNSHLISGVMQWELKWCWKKWVWEKMVLKCELFKSIPIHGQRLNYRIGVYELEDHVWEKGLSSN